MCKFNSVVYSVGYSKTFIKQSSDNVVVVIMKYITKNLNSVTGQT